MKYTPYFHSCFSLALLAALGCQPKGGTSANAPEGVAPAQAPAGGNLLKNSDFDDGKSLPWMTSFTDPASGEATVEDGALCINIANKGTNPWDAQVRHREMVIQKGHTYNISFKAWANKPTKVRPKLGMAGPPYAEYWAGTLDVTTEPQTFQGSFTMSSDDDPTAEFAFHLGGNLAAEPPLKLCLDDVYLTDPEFTPAPEEQAAPLPNVRVNQVGYFPGLAKHAVAVNAASTPLKWRLLGPDGKEVLSGETKPLGMDADSGDQLHAIDFSAATAPGDGYVLEVGTDKSYPFRIGNDIYKSMKYDALSYFYQNRSGIEIKADYVGDPKLARPAGHLSDKEVPCAPEAGCDYKLDVSGGWYDAGDHGKYVVNGGISLWTLFDQYERLEYLGSSLSDFADGKLKIPENTNKKNDLLDEARWEMEWMLKMQVPAGKKMAGMVHHKMHDKEWTALGMKPPTQTEILRFLHPVSTAATLNLAATAAQCGRIYKTVDAQFAAKCLKAAEVAYAAAKQHPALYAKKEDTIGGGPYDDNHVEDEFFWAAAELFITTKKQQYKADITKSPYYKEINMNEGSAPTSMTWALTDALGTISLAVVPGALPKAEQEAQRKLVVGAADAYLGLIDKQGYNTPFEARGGMYPWGSNSFVLNNALVMGLAYDFTKEQKYLQGVVEAMNYILGVNAMAQSYVTGYGDNPLEWPHHRFWSYQVNHEFPKAPPGAVSGGPNSSLQDPYAKAAGLKGCKPQKCFVDNIEAWSVNEITINWNAPFAWVASFLDEEGPKAAAVKSGATKAASGVKAH